MRPVPAVLALQEACRNQAEEVRDAVGDARGVSWR